MTKKAEREFLKLAAVWLAARHQIISGEWLGPPWPKPGLAHDRLACRDYAEEMRLLLREVDQP